jgi:homoserine dehydrogenase
VSSREGAISVTVGPGADAGPAAGWAGQVWRARRRRVARVAVLGYGRVGQAVAACVLRSSPRLGAAGIELQVVRGLVRDPLKLRQGPAIPLSSDGASVLAAGADVVVEVLGGVEPARTLVTAALRAGVPVVTANKTLVAACGPELRALARRHGTAVAFDAAVLAGVPFLGALARRPLLSDARRLEGVLNGTSNFVIGAMTRGAPLDVALDEARRLGYAEPDSSADTTGRDAAEKLVVLLQLAGCHGVRPSDLPCAPLDRLSPPVLDGARRLRGRIRPVALARLDPAVAGAWVGPAFVGERHPLAAVHGVANALRLTGATGETVTFAGPGAGPDVTAATIVDDVIEVLDGGNGDVAALDARQADFQPRALRQPPRTPWFVAVTGARAGADPASMLREPAPGIRRVERHGGWLFALTEPAPWPAVDRLLRITAADGLQTLALPALATDNS